MRWMLASCLMLCACAKSREPASSGDRARPEPPASPVPSQSAMVAPGDPVATGAVDPKEAARAQGQLAVGLPASAQGAFDPIDSDGNVDRNRNVTDGKVKVKEGGGPTTPPVTGGKGSATEPPRTPRPGATPVAGRATFGTPTLEGSSKSAAVQTALVARQADVLACYQQVLATNPSFTGSVEVAFVIAPGGTSLVNVSIATKSTSAALDDCVLQAVKPATLAAAIDKVPVRGKVTIRFAP